jgi:hypothetical protein
MPTQELTPDSFMASRQQASPAPSDGLTPESFMAARQSAPPAAPQNPSPYGGAVGSAIGKAEELATTPTSGDQGFLANHPIARRVLADIFPPAMAAEGTLQASKEADAIAQKEMTAGNPFRAGLASFLAGANKSVSNVASGFTSPAGLATAVLGPMNGVLRSFASLYFGFRGAQAAMQAALNTEAAPADRLEQGLMGAGTAFAGAAGELANFKDAARNLVQSKLGLSGDLANRVQQKVAAANEIKAQGDTQIAQAKAVTKTALQAKEAELADVQANIPRRTAALVADASHAVVQEQARVEQPFIDIGQAIQKPITDALSVRSIVYDAAAEHGVEDAEIPNKVFNALGSRGRVLDAGTGSPTGAGAGKELAVLGGRDIASETVSFNDLTRVRNDLNDAAQSAKDGAVRATLRTAYDKLTDLQEQAANEAGLGKQYSAAKADYMKFKRELGAGLMSDWLEARDIQEQAIGPKLAKLTTSVDAQALRTTLKVAGIDTSPLDDLISQRKQIKLDMAEIKKQGQFNERGIAINTSREVRNIARDNPVVSHTQDLDFANASNEELKVARFETLKRSMEMRGISNPTGYTMIVYGLVKMAVAKSNALTAGLFPLSYGAARTQLPELVLKPAFQDWVLRESGVEPSNKLLVFQMRRGIAGLYPLLRQLASSGAAAAVTAPKRSSASPSTTAPAPEAPPQP